MAQVSVGGSTVCALSQGGKVLCWGGSWGNRPRLVPNLDPAVQLVSNAHNACVVTGNPIGNRIGNRREAGRVVEAGGPVRCWSNDFAFGLAPTKAQQGAG